MSNNEVLTCPLCPYILAQGEIKYIAVSRERRREFLDYQIQKTLAMYASGNERVIKCPKQECNWMAEMYYPNERFKVECRKCAHEFCSLCNGQFHYRTTCEQVRECTQRWFLWCSTGETVSEEIMFV